MLPPLSDPFETHHRAIQQWYHQFAGLVLRSERTWLGDLLRPRQLLRRERSVHFVNGTEHMRSETRDNAVDGYHWRSTPIRSCPALKQCVGGTQSVALTLGGPCVGWR